MRIPVLEIHWMYNRNMPFEISLVHDDYLWITDGLVDWRSDFLLFSDKISEIAPGYWLIFN